nr:MAG TPA: hypothetical protein [Caudoviricetes sp.]
MFAVRLFLFSTLKLRHSSSPIRTCSISPHPTMSAVRSSLSVNLLHKIQDNNNTKHNTKT